MQAFDVRQTEGWTTGSIVAAIVLLAIVLAVVTWTFIRAARDD